MAMMVVGGPQVSTNDAEARETGTPHPTRVRLIEAAAQQIIERNTDELDVDAVLASVGVTKGALYHHFDSVGDLLMAAHLHIYGAIIDQDIAVLQSLLDECHSTAELRSRIAAISRVPNDPMRRANRLRRARILSLIPNDPSLAAQLAAEQSRLTDAFSEVIRAAQARGWFRPYLDAHALSVFIQAYALGRVVDDVADDHMDTDAWSQLVDHVLDAFLSED